MSIMLGVKVGNEEHHRKKYRMIRLGLQVLTESEPLLIIPLQNRCLYRLRDMEQFMKRDVTSLSENAGWQNPAHALYRLFLLL